MSDEKKIEDVARDAIAAQSDYIESNTDPERSLNGKIARLPDAIREELNQRLFDGQGGPEILAWLNDLPAVKEILARHFGAEPIKQQNLSAWRLKGYQRWRREKQNVLSAEKLGEYACKLTRAAGSCHSNRG